MAREIFISYSRRDLEKVKAIKSEIEQATSMECWMDINDIQADEEDYLDRIAEGIDKCRVFIFMLSKSSQESEHAVGELVAATNQQRKRGAHVVIINIDGCEMSTKFTVRFTTKNAILWSDAPQKDNLIRNLRDWLGVDEAKRKAEEELRRKAAEESKHKAEEESRKKAEDEAKRKAVYEAKRRAEEEKKAERRENLKKFGGKVVTNLIALSFAILILIFIIFGMFDEKGIGLMMGLAVCTIYFPTILLDSEFKP